MPRQVYDSPVSSFASSLLGPILQQQQARREQEMKLQQILMTHAAQQMIPSTEEQLNRLLLEEVQREQIAKRSQEAEQQRQRSLEANPPPLPVGPMLKVPVTTEQGPGFVGGNAETNEGYPVAMPILSEVETGSTTPPQVDQPSILQMMLRHKFGLPLPSAMLEEEARAKASGAALGNPLLAIEAAQKQAQTGLENVQAARAAQSRFKQLLPLTSTQVAPSGVKVIRKVKSGVHMQVHVPHVER